jgi:2',3'-cyclic-nucleotide 2'-phosphodiesterase (5'-nucleotidase family)
LADSTNSDINLGGLIFQLFELWEKHLKPFRTTESKNLGFWGFLSLLSIISYGFVGSRNLLAADQQLTILHTNDIHSHFRENTGPLHLGGLARIKTAIDQIRRNHTNTLLVDGGDWSEGDIYYTQGAGAESIRMMDRMSYDVAVIGNHDWINGPDVLLDSIRQAEAQVPFVSANLTTSGYIREQEFNTRILPYVIKNQNGVKIAFIGISTYEFIFDQFFAPIKITEPFFYTRKLAAQLKSEGKADIVIVLSHNSIWVNQGILKIAPDVDLIIGGHDHKKLTEPQVVTRSDGTEAWVVETGCWGEFLGQVDLSIDDHKKVKLLNYRLIQIDSRFPEDPEILNEIGKIEAKIETRLGPIFSDKIGESEVNLERHGQNAGIGNLIADAYFHTTGADFAMESTRFIYGELHPGIIRTVDAYNANPAIYDPLTEKSWSVKILPIRGKTLKWFLYALYASQKVSSFDLLNVSGLHFVYDPIFSPSVPEADWENSKLYYHLGDGLRKGWTDSLPEDPFSFAALGGAAGHFKSKSIPTVASITIQGRPLEPDKIYRVATGGGLITGLRNYNAYSPFPISLEGLEDTGLENWRVLADYIHANTPLTQTNVPIENRIQTLKPDVAIFYEDIQFQLLKTTAGELKGRQKNLITAKILVHIKNYGAMQLPEKGSHIRLFLNENGHNHGINPKLVELGIPIIIKGLKPNEEQLVSWDVTLPFQSAPYEITAKIDGNLPQVHLNNLEATRWFKF